MQSVACLHGARLAVLAHDNRQQDAVVLSRRAGSGNEDRLGDARGAVWTPILGPAVGVRHIELDHSAKGDRDRLLMIAPVRIAVRPTKKRTYISIVFLPDTVYVYSGEKTEARTDGMPGCSS